MDNKKEKLINLFMKRGMTREQAEKEAEFRIQKANKIREMFSNKSEIEVMILGGTVNDRYYNVVQEINKIIEELGLEEAEQRGYVRLNDDGSLKGYVDYRMSIKDKKNPTYGMLIDEIPDNKRYLGSYYAITEVDGEYKLVKVFYAGKSEIPSNKIRLLGNMNKDDRGITIFAEGDYQILGEVDNNKVREILSKYKIEIKDAEKRLRDWEASGRQGQSFSVFEGAVIDVTPNDGYRGGTILIEGNDAEETLILKYGEDDLPDIGDEILALTFLYKQERNEEEVLVAKCYFYLLTSETNNKVDVDKMMEQKMDIPDIMKDEIDQFL